MEVTKTAFAGSFKSLAQIPRGTLPEIGFIGRSNVGKSSIINRLLGVKRLAQISSTPGKTRKINLFKINDSFFFVDLPGYGYAKVPKREKAQWQKMIEGYLSGSKNLRLLILLIDARLGALDNDRLMMDWLVSHKLPYLTVLTKADKLKKNKLANDQRKLSDPEHELHGAVHFSSVTGEGMKKIWGAIDAAIAG